MFPGWLASTFAVFFLGTGVATLFTRTPRTEDERRIASLYRIACNLLAFAGTLMVLSKHEPSEQRSGEFLGGAFVLGFLGTVYVVLAWRSSRTLKRRAASIVTGQIVESRRERRRRLRAAPPADDDPAA